jgi:PIN domain nuclease of toxin-antitoxin system
MGCAQVIVLDTHAAIWFVRDDPALGRRSRSLAERALADDELSISAISFWELALLIAKGRLRSLRNAAEQRMTIIAAGIRELPLTGDIAMRAVELDTLPGDPADRFIAATAIIHGATLMTADDRLLGWRHTMTRQNASR